MSILGLDLTSYADGGDSMQQGNNFTELHKRLFNGEGIRIVWDCDPGSDDYVAFAAAAGEPNLTLTALIASAGNLSRAFTLNNALFMVEKSGVKVPVYAGAQHPFGITEKNMPEAISANGSSGLGNVLSAELIQNEIHTAAVKRADGDYEDGADVLATRLYEEEKPFTVLTTGALTGLAKALFALQWQLEDKSGRLPTPADDARNALIREVIYATSREGQGLSSVAQDILNGRVSLSILITPRTRAFLQQRIDGGVIQAIVIMGGVFPETEATIEQALLEYPIHNIGADGIYRSSDELLLEHEQRYRETGEYTYVPQYASPSNGLLPEYGWHANAPLLNGQGEKRKPHEKTAEFNFAHDPVATQMVFSLFRELGVAAGEEGRKLPILLLPLNTTHKVLIGDYNMGQFLNVGDGKEKSFAQWTADVVRGTGIGYARRVAHYIAPGGMLHRRQMVHDALTVVALAHPELFRYERRYVTVDDPSDHNPAAADGKYRPNEGRISAQNRGTEVYVLDAPAPNRAGIIDALVKAILRASVWAAGDVKKL